MKRHLQPRNRVRCEELGCQSKGSCPCKPYAQVRLLTCWSINKVGDQNVEQQHKNKACLSIMALSNPRACRKCHLTLDSQYIITLHEKTRSMDLMWCLMRLCRYAEHPCSLAAGAETYCRLFGWGQREVFFVSLPNLPSARRLRTSHLLTTIYISRPCDDWCKHHDKPLPVRNVPAVDKR